MKFVFNFCILSFSALPVLLAGARGRQTWGARRFVLPVLLCLAAAAAAFVFRQGASAAVAALLFSVLVFVCTVAALPTGAVLCRLYEAAVRSSAALLPMTAAFLLSLPTAHTGMLFGWPYVPLFALFALPAVLVPRLFSGEAECGTLDLSEDRTVSPCFLLLALELSAPAALLLGGATRTGLLLLPALAASVMTQLLWKETALYAAHLSALTQQKQRELDAVLALARDAGASAASVSPLPDEGRGPGAFPLIQALMQRIRREAAACGAEADIYLQLRTLEGFSQQELCSLFDLLCAPALRAVASGPPGCKLRIRAREDAEALAFSAGCAGGPLQETDTATAIAAVSAAGGWAEYSEHHGFGILSLVLFRPKDSAAPREAERSL